MKKIQLLSALFLGLLTASPALAGVPAAKTYQVTGPIVEVTDDVLTIEKGREKWQIDRTKETKVTGGDLKVGTKVTVQYRMTAESVEIKDTKSKVAKDAKDAKDTKEAKPAEAKTETKAAEAPKAEAPKPTPAKAAEPAKK